ncbi:hypothetical protein [Streptomyces sp. NPDC019507]|uniref:hypothetical protein n=1 Tax=Streptomyces sp. NPDC019507 TaxID=3154689 RepID=UPI0033F70D4D
MGAEAEAVEGERVAAQQVAGVALASLTAEPDPEPVTALAEVGISGRTLTVTWQDGTTAVRTCGPPWS